MSKKCIITGKHTLFGNLVSHSNTKVRRQVHVNLQKRRLTNPATGRLITVVISTSGLRTLQKWNREGKKYDLAELSARGGSASGGKRESKLV